MFSRSDKTASKDSPQSTEHFRFQALKSMPEDLRCPPQTKLKIKGTICVSFDLELFQ